MRGSRVEAALDTIYPVQTPEGVDLDLRLAGPVVRAYAWLTDLMLRFGIYLVLLVALGVLGRFGSGLMLICVFVIEWFYPVFFEVYSAGQTPGKRMMGIRVVYRDGTPVGWSGSLIRNLLRTADLLPGFYAFGLASMLIDKSFRRLGDLAAGTVVVYPTGAPARRRDIPDAPPLASPLPLDLEEQRAVIAFAERSPFLSRERAVELASIPEPLIDGEDPRRRLFRIAAWLVGRRPSGGTP